MIHYTFFRLLLTLILALTLTSGYANDRKVCEIIEKIQKTGVDDNAKKDKLFQSLLGLYNAGKTDKILGRGLYTGGNFYVAEQKYVIAMDFYTAALQNANEYDDQECRCLCLFNIANIFTVFRDFERAIYYFQLACDISSKLGFSQIQYDAMIVMTSVYCELGDLKNAERYHQMSKAFNAAEIDRKEYCVYYNQGMIDYLNKEYAKSIASLEKAILVLDGRADAPDSDYEKIGIYDELSKAQFALRQTDLALASIHRSIDLALKTDMGYLRAESYLTIIDYYKQMGRHDSTAYYQSLYMNLSDSILNQQFFNNEKNKLFSLEEREQNKHITRLNRQMQAMLIGLSFIVVILIIIFYYNRKLKNAHRLVVSLNEDLTKQINVYAKMAMNKPKGANNPVVESKEGDEGKSTTALTAEKSEELLRAILEQMNDIELISELDFSMAVLAKRINSNTAYVSAVINDTYHKNFKSFLNEYRIREACRRLTDNDTYQGYTIEAIATSVGFSSPSSFVTAFKKIMGMTPSAYQKISKEQNDG